VTEPDAAPTPDGEGWPFVRLTLAATTVPDPLEPALLRERRTSRLPYDGRPAPAALLGLLADVAADYGQRLAWTDDPELVEFVVGLNRDTLFFDMADPRVREEVGRWLRFSNAEAEGRRDGFSPECLGFPGWLLRLFFRRHELLELPLLRGVVRRLYVRTTRGTRTVAWLSAPFETPTDWLRAGRALARLWLTLTQNGVVLHPFGSIVTNPTANARLKERIPIDESEGTLWLIMRLGYSAQPPRSLRLRTDELLVD
jgi:hypothetical protein